MAASAGLCMRDSRQQDSSLDQPRRPDAPHTSSISLIPGWMHHPISRRWCCWALAAVSSRIPRGSRPAVPMVCYLALNAVLIGWGLQTSCASDCLRMTSAVAGSHGIGDVVMSSAPFPKLASASRVRDRRGGDALVRGDLGTRGTAGRQDPPHNKLSPPLRVVRRGHGRGAAQPKPPIQQLSSKSAAALRPASWRSWPM